MSSHSPMLRLGRHASLALALTIVAGFSALQAPTASAATTTTTGATELSPTPVNQTQAEPPNIVVTFDDSGSMASDFMGDTPPYGANTSWGSGPWYCAGLIDASATSGLGTLAMNGVYYNPNVTYTPPVKADGTSFPNADATLAAVQNDGITANRPLNPSTGDGTTNFNNGTTKKNGRTVSTYWECPYDAGRNNNLGSTNSTNTHTSSPVSGAGGGPYYYRYTGPALVDNGYGAPNSASLANLYTRSNWTAVQVPTSQYQNWANWWAYYRTRNQMARSSLARVFGSASLASTTSTGGYGSTIRVAWQNLYTYDAFTLQNSTIITSLIDASSATCTSSEPTLGSQSLISTVPTTTVPSYYRSDFYNWIFQVPATSGTPTRSAMARAGLFFERGGSLNTNVSKGDLHDPYWQPSATGSGTGSELSCRQNFHMLITDGLWNGGQDGPQTANLANTPSTTTSLPDGTAFPTPAAGGVTAIYSQVNDGGDSGYASLSDLAFNYWATNLRPDLYDPANGKFVAPYINDTTTGVVTSTTSSSGGTNDANVNDEVYFNPRNDPANWPHMSEYLIGLGVNGVLNYSSNTDCSDTSAVAADACALRKGAVNSSGSRGWPIPDGSGSGIAANIDDTWHAALAGRGQFFSAANPSDLVTKLSSVLTSITARAATPAIGAVNASVLTTGALSFQTGYSPVDWTGALKAYGLNADGTTGPMVWDAGTTLTGGSPLPASRKILTSRLGSGASVATGMSFEPASSFDATETAGLGPASPTTTDTATNRINYLRGVRTYENNGTYRTRDSLLGAIIDSQPVYVSFPSSGYINNWPSGSPEATAAAASNGTDDKSYDSFVSDHAARDPTVYVGANDGMLHAFYAPVPTCNNTDPSTGFCTSYSAGANAGQELFAYVPRAVYGNLGNLTSTTSFTFQPTVNGTPVTSDVFFSENSQDTWHTLLVAGLRLGGRGVYALDITDPATVTETNASTNVLWEFDSDVAASTGCTAIKGSSSDSTGCKPADLGFTYGQPNIGRLANGKWVVLVPSGYFPDCSQTDKPVICNTSSPPATPKDSTGKTFSSLFVLDAQTGALIAELKTPTSITGVASYGLSSPVLGDYNNDQIDDVAFAGDLAGNVWRFDLSDPSPSNWKVTLTYQPTTQGAQPITTMPRLFPDSTTNRFMVVFGTGKYLGANDNSSTAIQAVYGIRDTLDSSGNPLTVSGTTSLVQQTLGTVTVSSGALAGATLLTLTNNAVGSSANGWYFNLATYTGSTQTDAGERVVVTPAALFNSNTVVISTLVPGTSDPCNPTTTGSIMFVDAGSGSPGTAGVSSLGGYPYVGAQVNNVRTSGSLPVTTPVGGGSTVLPGVTISGTNPAKTLTGNASIWRRRSWSILTNDE